MSIKKTKNISDMEAQRRELDRQIRAAKRAKKKAAAEALQSARQRVGVDLAVAVGADSPETVEALRQALMSDRMQAWLRQQISPGSSDGPVPGAAQVGDIDRAKGGDHGDHA